MPQLLDFLADCQSHSFDDLTALLGVNKTKLLAQLAELQAQGIEIDSTTDEVKILPQTTLLSADKIQGIFPKYKIIYHPIIHSTNQFMLENIARLNKGDVCLTEHQTAGRGRRGRRWQSPFAGLAMFSLLWQVDASKPVDGLSLVIGMAICEALRKLGGQAELKWPNDILYAGRKLAGILIEIANAKDGKLNLVIGVGINVAVLKTQNQIDQPWANVQEFLPQIDRTSLLIAVLDEIYQALADFEKNGITAEFQQKWCKLDAFFGKQVNVIKEKETISGIEQGIDLRGYLSVQTQKGLAYFNGGEVSLRLNV